MRPAFIKLRFITNTSHPDDIKEIIVNPFYISTIRDSDVEELKDKFRMVFINLGYPHPSIFYILKEDADLLYKTFCHFAFGT